VRIHLQAFIRNVVKHRQGKILVNKYVEDKTHIDRQTISKGLDKMGYPSTRAIIQTSGKQSPKGKKKGQSKNTKAIIKTQIIRLDKTKI